MSTLTSSPADVAFVPARRVHPALTAKLERRFLLWAAERMPACIGSDHLTALGFAAQCAAGAAYALAPTHRLALLAVVMCLALNWFGDSLDGTLARYRSQERPRFGFYVDHICDIFGTLAMMAGLAYSGLLHPAVAAGMLIGFLILAAESFLATHTLGRFELSQGWFGPTELRILLAAGTLAALRRPYAHLLGHRWLLFDIGGMIASASMCGLALTLAARHTAQLYREEPLP